MPLQDIPHGLVGNAVAQIGQGTDDPIITPARIVSGQSHDQLFNLNRNGWASGLGVSPTGEIPFLGNQAPMPVEQGLELDNGDDFGQQPAEGFPLLGQRLALGIVETPAGGMPVQERAIDPILLEHECRFLAQGLIDLAGGPGE